MDMTTIETFEKPRRFYQTMAWVFVAIAFGGFIPTYWLKLMDGSFAGKPILHIHGFMLFAWVLFYAVQTNFVANALLLRPTLPAIRGSHRALKDSHAFLGLRGVQLDGLLHNRSGVQHL